MSDEEGRVVLLRSKVESAQCDMDGIIKDLKLMSNGGFAIFKGSRATATLSVYIQNMSSKSAFSTAWGKLYSSTFFTRPVLCSAQIVLSSILGNEEYQGSKMIYSEKPASCLPSISSQSAPLGSLQITPPKSSKKSPNKLSFRPIRRLSFPPVPLPELSPRSYPAPPFYYSGYVDYTEDGNWRVNFSKFFEEVVVPEDDAYSSYMNWVECRAYKMRCKVLALSCSELEELYFEVCDHRDCHEYADLPCTGCESLVCKCSELVLDNSWTTKIRRALMVGDREELERCQVNFALGVKNDPDVLYRDRVQMLKRSNYQTHLSQFTSDQKVERCNAFCQRLFLSPGSSSCTTLSELRKNLWRLLRHSSFFLKKIFNPYSQRKIEF